MAIDIGGNEVHALNCVRNLGVYFDKHVTMERHVKSKCRAAYPQLYNIRKVRKSLDHQSADILIQAQDHSHNDFVYSLLIGLPKYLVEKVQMVQNTAVRVYDHITEVTSLVTTGISH